MGSDSFPKFKNRLKNMFRKPKKKKGKNIPFKKKERKLKPFTDIFETKNDLVIRLDLPGVKKEDIAIRMNPTTLVVTAKINKYTVTKTDSFHKKERKQSRYYRRGDLPIPIDHNTIRATYKAGVLEIKAKKAKSKKLVRVKQRKPIKKTPKKNFVKKKEIKSIQTERLPETMQNEELTE
jgi:HSP20 family protein